MANVEEELVRIHEKLDILATGMVKLEMLDLFFHSAKGVETDVVLNGTGEPGAFEGLDVDSIILDEVEAAGPVIFEDEMTVDDYSKRLTEEVVGRSNSYVDYLEKFFSAYGPHLNRSYRRHLLREVESMLERSIADIREEI